MAAKISLESREREILTRLEGAREMWVDAAKGAADRLSGTLPGSDTVVWLMSVVGSLARQSAEYQELVGRLREVQREKAEGGVR